MEFSGESMKARSVRRRGGASHYDMALVNEVSLKQHWVYRPLAGYHRGAMLEEKDVINHGSVTPRVTLFPNYPHYKLNQASSALVNQVVEI
jgi:hypothetical protein